MLYLERRARINLQNWGQSASRQKTPNLVYYLTAISNDLQLIQCMVLSVYISPAKGGDHCLIPVNATSN